MNCRTIQSMISAYIDEELSPRDIVTVRAHLQDCEVCQQEELELRELKRFLRELRIEAPQDDLLERTLAVAMGQPVATRRSWFARPPFAYACAFATCVILAGAVWVSHRSGAVDARTMQARTRTELDLERDHLMMHDGDLTTGSPIISASYVGR